MNKSINSLKTQLNNIDHNPEILGLQLDLKSHSSISSKSANLKLFLSSVISILTESKNQKNVLFLCDDLNLIHNECLASLGQDGHQVNHFIYFNLSFLLIFYEIFLQFVLIKKMKKV